MYPVSERLAALSPSETLAMSQKSNELKAQGIDVINLSVGEPDFYTPDHIKEAAKQAVDNNFSFYSPVPGYPALRNAICSKLKTENNDNNIALELYYSLSRYYKVTELPYIQNDENDHAFRF